MPYHGLNPSVSLRTVSVSFGSVLFSSVDIGGDMIG